MQSFPQLIATTTSLLVRTMTPYTNIYNSNSQRMNPDKKENGISLLEVNKMILHKEK